MAERPSSVKVFFDDAVNVDLVLSGEITNKLAFGYEEKNFAKTTLDKFNSFHSPLATRPVHVRSNSNPLICSGSN